MALSEVTISLNLADKVGALFDARRTKAWVTTTADVVHDTEGHATRVGTGQGTVGTDGIVTWDVWTPGTGSNPASWQTTFHVDCPDRNAPKGRKTLSFGPFTVTAAAWIDQLVTEMEIPPETLGGDAWLATIDADDASQYRQQQDARLLATIAGEAIVKDGGVLQRLRDAGDGLSQAVDYRHRGTSGYVFHGVTEAGSGGFLAAYGTDEGGAGAVLRSHKNSAASEHAIGHGGSSLLNYWQGYSASSLLHAEVYRGNQGLKVLAKTGQGFGDGVTTSASTTFTSASAVFSVADVGRTITQTTTRGSIAPSGCIPSSTTIAAYVSPTEVTLSQAAGASGTTIPFLIGGRAVDTTQQLLTFYDDNGTTILGQIRKAGWDWYGTGSTSTAAVSMTSGGILASRFGTSLSNIGGAGQNGVTVTNYQTASHTIFAKGVASQTGDQIHIEDSAGVIQSRVNKAGYFMTRKSAAPALGDMADGETALWIDTTTGDLKVTSRISGALKTGTVTVA